MKMLSKLNEIRMIAVLLLTSLVFAAYSPIDPGKDKIIKAAKARKMAPLILQPLDYTENPVDIPNPDRGAYRGRWQNIPTASVNETNSPFGITPEVDHRVPVNANSMLYHGRQVPAVEGDDIVETQFYNGVNQGANPYVGGTGINALPSLFYVFRPL